MQESEQAPTIESLLASMITEVNNPERLLELYYWTQEDGITSTIRSFMAFPPPVREALRAMAAMTSNPKSISMSVDGAGRLTLISPEVQQTLALVKEAALPKKRRA